MGKLIYVVEDDEDIRELIMTTLNSSGFSSEGFEDAIGFFTALKTRMPALVLLDIMLPNISGRDILKQMKADTAYKNLPVIFLTAKTSELDKVKGLDLGADDYIAKPFGILELIARVNAVLRRYDDTVSQNDTVKKYKDLAIDTASKQLYRNAQEIKLTHNEYKLFIHLYENRGMVLSRDTLLESVWNFSYDGGSRTVDMHIKSLRQKLGDNPDEPIYIATIRGFGYKLLKENDR